MAEPSNGGDESPLLEPRILKRLKERDRKFGFGLRDELWDELEEIVRDNRKPSSIADKVASSASEKASRASRRVVKKGAKDQLDKINKT